MGKEEKRTLKDRFRKRKEETGLAKVNSLADSMDNCFVKENSQKTSFSGVEVKDSDFQNVDFGNINLNEINDYMYDNFRNANYQQNINYQQEMNYQQGVNYQQNVNYQQGVNYQQNVNYQPNMNYQQNNIEYQQNMRQQNINNINYQQSNIMGNQGLIEDNIIDVDIIDEQSKEQTNKGYSESTAKERQKERFIRKSTHISAKYLRKMSELKGAPNNIKYFEKVLEDVFVNLKDVKKEDDVKTVGTYCVMVPSEIIYAAGAMPVKLCCGNYTAFDIGEEVSPRDACPLVKSILGATAINVLPLYDNCSLMVVPTTCDCKKKMVTELAKEKKAIPIHIPTSKKDDEDLEYFVDDLYRFVDELEKITGNKITYKKLLNSIELVAETQYEISRFYELKKSVPSIIKGTHAMAIMNAYSYDRIDRWGNALRLLNDELEMNLSNGKFVSKNKQPRIMITGSPIVFPNIKIPLLIEEMGGILVADETCMGERGVYDPVAIVDRSFDGLMRSLAKRYILPCSCPTFVNNEQRIFKIKQMIEDNKVEGVVYHVLRGCVVYDYEYQFIEAELEKIGIPVIRLETDYNEEDIEQLRIRIEAFIEMIKFENLKKE